MPTLRAGAARADITPPVGCVLIGFSQRRATGVHDALHVKALVLDNETTPLALAVCDVLTFGFDIVARAREQIRAQTGIPPENVMLTTTHTHSGPLTAPCRLYDEQDTGYVESLIGKIADTVTAAWNSRRDAKLGFATEPVQIGINRRELTPDRGMILGRNPDGPADRDVDVLRIDGSDAQPIAVLFSHAAHPVVLGPKNLEISADFPGCATAAIEQALGPNTIAIFAQGCCGNINAQWLARGFPEAEQLGRTLGNAALKAAASATLATHPCLSARSRIIALPLAVPTVTEAQQRLRRETDALAAAKTAGEPHKLRRAEANLAWAQDQLAATKAGTPRTIPYELQVLGIDRTAVVGLPGEVFVEIGTNIADHATADHTIVLGYANEDIGFAGYVPTAEAFEQGGYEPNAYRYSYRPFPLDPGCASLIEQEAVKLVAQTLKS